MILANIKKEKFENPTKTFLRFSYSIDFELGLSVPSCK